MDGQLIFEVQQARGVLTDGSPGFTRRLDPLTSLEAARDMDRRVDEGLARLGIDLARSYLELGQHLCTIYQTRGYKLLGYERWEDYLASKRTYGRTYLSYILRLGQAGNLDRYVEAGLGASQLIEYAKAARDPLEIPALIDETWPLVQGRSIREMRRILSNRPQRLGDIRKIREAVWPHRLRRTLLRRMRELPREQQAEFLDALREFLVTEGARLGLLSGEAEKLQAARTIPANES